ncbi:MAG TPA: hypothetical protein VFL91_29070 [Thermomicrobiales bacterium]|nr:hypothetical protein [Thermomicrobiales bacterium]
MDGPDAPLPAEEEAIDVAFAAMADDEAYQAEALALAEASLANEWLLLRESESDDPARSRERGER